MEKYVYLMGVLGTNYPQSRDLMLISFSIENWMSFHAPVSLSMIASRKKKHGKRIPRVAKFQTRILPVASISGGNASGKTNLFKALSFAKWLVLTGSVSESPWPVEPYRMDRVSRIKPSRFRLELLVDELIYEFSFAITTTAIVEEKLVKKNSTSEKILYDRKGDTLEIHPSLKKDLFLHFASKGARENQLFLTNLVAQNVDIFRPVYDWFRDNLEFIAPDTRFGFLEPFLAEEHPLFSTMNGLLQELVTGISHLGLEKISLADASLSEDLKSRLKEELREGMNIILNSPNIGHIVMTRKAGELVANQLVAFHQGKNGTTAKFALHQESNGVQRLIHLLTAFLDLSAPNSKKVYIIDDVDRNLHSLLTRHLIETYLANCLRSSRAQLLLTSHNILLMDQALFRRDEMWVTERNHYGGTGLVRLSELMDPRYYRDTQKSYLQGSLGGVPKFRCA